MAVDLSKLSAQEILATHVSLMQELHRRGILRSNNNPTGVLVEYLYCVAFDWYQAPNSEKGFDAEGSHGNRYQIMARRLTGSATSGQLSAIRDLDGFSFLAGILFDDQYQVLRAAIVPQRVVRRFSNFVEHTNSYRFILRESVWDEPGVRDVTKHLTDALSAI
ncbi:MAG: hypothetical protein ACU0C9_11480 [Paracoccaceae bacterium]